MRAFSSSFPLLLFFLTVSSSWADPEEVSPYPFRKGTTWTYSDSEGTQKKNVVEGFKNFSTEWGNLTGALLRRMDGNLRFILKTKTKWVDCGSISIEKKELDCSRPIILLQWPLEKDQKWENSNLVLWVTQSEPVQVPLKLFEKAWHIQYGSAGTSDSFGELWFVENFGPVRMLELENDLQLVQFSLGEGPELPSIEETVLQALIQQSEKNLFIPIQEPFSFEKKFGSFLKNRWMEILYLFFLFLILGLGWILIRALRSQEKETDEEKTPETSLSEIRECLNTLWTGGNLSQAKKQIQELIQKFPKYPDLRLHMARILRGEGDWERAKEQLESALQINPQYTEAQWELGKLLLGQGKLLEGKEEFQKIVDSHPQFPDAQIELGRAFMGLGDFSKASTCFEKALAINPSLVVASQLLSQCRDSTQK